MNRRTGGVRWNGTPHHQPSFARRYLCALTGGHRFKFGAHPSGSCVRCSYWPANRR